ncbi:MAG TPA: cold shock and DUF1294 domain-containing protein [Propionibacteriaceae bacterium]|nr:cold shock and DUF1294 domain-containing protein [Propionibacteriaceae bacterium]
MSQEQGSITRWDDARGFGFIRPDAGGSDVFVHVTELPRGTGPRVGARVAFGASRDDRGRLRAHDVRYVGRTGFRKPVRPAVLAAGAVSGSFLALLCVLTALGTLPVIVPAVSLVLSPVAVVMYRVDKTAAVAGGWRTREATLQVVSLLGGWPGALLAQHLFRHKTRKRPFQTVYWLTVVANCLVLAWVAIGNPLPA